MTINEDREELESLRVEMRGYLNKDGNKINTERGDIHLIPKKEIVPKQKIPVTKKKTEKIKMHLLAVKYSNHKPIKSASYFVSRKSYASSEKCLFSPIPNTNPSSTHTFCAGLWKEIPLL